MGREYKDLEIITDNLKRVNGNVSWVNSVGVTLPYKLDGKICGDIKIISNVPPSKIMVSIDGGEPQTVIRQCLLNNEIAKFIGVKARKFAYNVGDIVGNTKILEQKLNDKNKTTYRIKCLIDGYEHDVIQAAFIRGVRNGNYSCPVCNNHIIVDGINSLADLNPDLAMWFVDKELAHRIPLTYKEDVELECPNCHRRLRMKPCNISTLPLCVCGDGVSYPEKMFSCVLNQLGIDYIHQLTKRHFDWCLSYRYDFYFKHDNNEYIFEIDGGLGHGWKDLNGRGTQKIDDIKDRLANQNGVSVYRIDANYPNIDTRFDYIKDNIINSYLSTLFNLNDVDWGVVKNDSANSILVNLCGDFVKGKTTIKMLADKYHIGHKTARRYLKVGAEIGLCNYDAKLSYKHYVDNYLDDNPNSNIRIVKVGYMGNEYYIKRISRVPSKLKEMFNINIDISTIYKHLANPNKKSRKGLTFSYATEEEIENLKEVI